MGHRPKALLLRDGEPLIVRHLRALAAAGVSKVVVVLGHHAAQIAPVLQKEKLSAPTVQGLEWVLNPHPDEGPGSSLRCALAALPPDVDAVLVALADQPLVTAGDIRAVLAAWHGRAPGSALLVPRFEGQPGHPLVFDGAVRRAVMTQPALAGLREWRRTHPEQVTWLDADHPRHTVDVDTPEHLERLEQLHGVRLEWPADPA